MQPVVHPQTERLLDRFKTQLPQSLLLTGEPGVGLLAIAQHIAGRAALAILRPQNIKEQTDNEHGTIGVDAIRNLYGQTRAKHSSRQVVIIDNADRMNEPGQSAFLKLLEEPNQYINFILLSHQPDALKSTILSRVQRHHIRTITDQQTTELIVSLGVTDSTKTAQLRFIASGRPAEIVRLVQDDNYFAASAASVGDARVLIQASTYDRLLLAQKYHNNRDGAKLLLESAMTMARRTLSTKPQPALVAQLDRLLAAQRQLSANGNVRLVLAATVV
ncbi:MAG: AAA family ATPase [Candidatus Saccharimonadales bacterium]